MRLFNFALLPVAAMALSACVIIVDNDDDHDYTPKDEPADECGAADYKSLVGSPIAAVTLPADLNARIIHPGDMVTKDYRLDRLNIDVDEDGNVTRVYCG
ncbi:I78 family peptidase inhibitor [Parvularcula marina]|uniref:I78 family peptidase inhibitor n=1 Tax=Parvularcula marina TaxID=2292771 RepID=UPI00351381C0